MSGDDVQGLAMRRPHVFERSAPRMAREPFQEPHSKTVTARLISAQLGNMVEKADQAGLTDLADMLESARLEAERTASL